MEGDWVSKTEFKARAYRPLERDPFEVLRGSVVKFDNPTEPVGEDDWEGAR
jgi:hypothetical protein